MFFCEYWEISKHTYLKNICVPLLLKRFQEVIIWDFFSEKSLSKPSWLSNIKKIPVTFKPEPSLNFTPTLYFEPRFPMFTISGFDRKATLAVPCLSFKIFVNLLTWFFVTGWNVKVSSQFVMCLLIQVILGWFLYCL